MTSDDECQHPYRTRHEAYLTKEGIICRACGQVLEESEERPALAEEGEHGSS